MENNYENNIRLEKRFAKQIKAILGMTFIGQDSEQDTKFATDFLVFNVNPFKVACRLRTYNYYLNPKYKQQFTIRCKLHSGNETELDKIRKGFADYIFYGFVDANEEKIIKYFIGDLNVFRDNEGGMKKEVYPNKDKNPSWLAAYYISQFPKEFIIKQYPDVGTIQ
jgi:hypothetical protein